MKINVTTEELINEYEKTKKEQKEINLGCQNKKFKTKFCFIFFF